VVLRADEARGLQPPLAEKGQNFFFGGVDGVKWRKPLVPGDVLVCALPAPTASESPGGENALSKGPARAAGVLNRSLPVPWPPGHGDARQNLQEEVRDLQDGGQGLRGRCASTIAIATASPARVHATSPVSPYLQVQTRQARLPWRVTSRSRSSATERALC
jgi:hypothetical protein